MRTPHVLGAVSLTLWTLTTTASGATTVRTQEEAATQVRSKGFPLVSKSEQTPGAWTVWASRDGIAYAVTIDAQDGAMIAAVPIEAND